ncbi:hypothetical protein N1851_017978 [Merluccius polli]|uniref:Uncharacterized protein n=1 Tax=Merluccius polli TaxID=89951 RepID=A0AA47NYQ5_MERPO|nr:hypothetical protein N1851_017978 [Merluccius polli]
MSSLMLARRQVWLAQSPLSETCRRTLRTLPVVPGELFGPAAQQALDRGIQANQTQQQFASLRGATSLPRQQPPQGAQRRNPPRAVRVPSWDLPLVLGALRLPPFEPLDQAPLKWLSAKFAFLLAIASAKRASELHALSVSEQCIRWNSDGTGVALWPNPSFFPRGAHYNQVIELAAYGPSHPPDEEASSAELLCPVRALRCYIQETAGFRQSDGLFVCYGGPRKGQALSRQRLSKWVVEVIEEAYKSRGLPLPLNIRGHSTRRWRPQGQCSCSPRSGCSCFSGTLRTFLIGEDRIPRDYVGNSHPVLSTASGGQ